MCHKFIRKFTGTQKAENAIASTESPPQVNGEVMFTRFLHDHCATARRYQVTNEKLLYSLSVPVRTDLRGETSAAGGIMKCFMVPTYFSRKKCARCVFLFIVVVVAVTAHQCNIINSHCCHGDGSG